MRVSLRRLALNAALVLCGASALIAAVVPVGGGSYTTTFPGTDSAGRNAVPPGTPNLSGAALGKPVPTNDWWSNFLTTSFGGNCFNYPLNFKSLAGGLVVNYTVPNTGPREYRQPMSDVMAIVVGTNNLAATKASVCDYSDWTVTLSWDDKFFTTLGQGMPFQYYTKASAEVAKVAVNFNAAGVTVSGNKLIIQNNMNGANYVVYAPAGSTWAGSGGVYTSTLNGKNFWSMALLPPGTNVATMTTEYEKYAYVFPGDTKVAWTYTPTTGVVRTTFTTTPTVKEGSNSTMLQGLLPHQWAHLASDSTQPGIFTYKTVRGQMKMLASNTFYVENIFSGILPTLPNLAKYSAAFSEVPGFDPAALTSRIDQMKNDGLDLWTDTYNEGQAMNRLMQAARIADQLGYTSARDTLVATLKTRLENWFTATSGEVAFLFYYNTNWTTLIGYPAGYSTDGNINDHHFHWGYFINAAAMVEQYNPGWSAQWGGMVNMLVRDVASPNRTDALFPFLRNFNPYDGHAWGNGTSNQPFGVDEESSPESMNFNAGLIHWGLATGNTEVRDLGVYLYTTEQTAVDEYWFDVNERTFQPEYIYPMVARIWAGGYDNGTWWTNTLGGCYGIQMYPIHAGSLYLGYSTDYVQRVWDGVLRDTDVMSNLTAAQEPNCWYDVFWCYQAFKDPEGALTGYNRWLGRSIKTGISDAQTYHWLHTMHALGTVRHDISADYPTAAVFDKASVKTYVAHNYGSSAITVHFSDGASLVVPARSMATNRDINVTATLAASAAKIAANGTVTLTATVVGSGITKVEFYKDGTLIGTKTSAPYTFNTVALAAGLPRFYVKAYVGSNCNLSNVVKVQVGGQTPYGGTAPTLPCTIQAGDYDVFEGGFGQGVTYSDTSSQNVTAANGGNTWRPDEAVDAGIDSSEGHTVGWIDAGEWLTYTVNVPQTGTYKVTVNTASGNQGGGGPFWFELNGVQISPNITVLYSDQDWSIYQPTVVDGLTLPAGQQVLCVKVGTSGFNLGKMKFEPSNVPVAPSFATQPSNQSVYANGAATFHAVATGNPTPTYQWQRYVGSTWTNLSGATAADYTTPAIISADNGAKFRVVATNSMGATPSNAATLTVLSSALTFTLQPVAQTAVLGSAATYSSLAVAGNNPVTYQWYRRGAGTAYVAIPGATAATYTLSATTMADHLAAYYVIATSGGVVKESNHVLLTVVPAITIVTQPLAQTVEAGLSATFTVVATAPNAALTYQWFRRAPGGSYLVVPGATSASYTTAVTTSSDNASGVFVRLTAGASSKDSNHVLLTVDPATTISITLQPMAQNVQEGQAATYQVTASASRGAVSYQWYKRVSGGAYTIVPGATSASYTTAVTTSLDTASAVFVRLTAGTASKDSNHVLLTVNPAITITTQPANTTVSEGQTATFHVAATANVGAVPSFQWQRLVGSTWTNLSGATAADYTTPVTAYAGDNLALFRAVASNANGTSYSNKAKLTITPVTPSAPGSLTVGVSGTTLNLQWSDLATNETGYRVYISTSNSKPASFVALPASSTSYAASGLPANTKHYLWVEAYNAAGASSAATTNATTGNSPLPVLIDDFNSAQRWNVTHLNSLGKAITTSGGLYNLEGEANLYFFFNGGDTAESFTERIDQSLAGLSSLVLAIQGVGGSEQNNLTLVLNDGSDHSVSMASYGTLTTSYQNISIPLSAFGANLASTAYLRVEGRGVAKTIRINNISVQ